MALPQPTKCRLRHLSINGVDLTAHVNKLAVYETIHKPYHTAKVTILDNANILDNLALIGGEACPFAFDAGDGLIYDNVLYVFSVHGEKSNQSLKTMIYNINLIGIEYFNDKKNIVQKSFKGMPGTAAISQISNQFIGGGLKVLASSMGPISLQSYIVSGQKPFKAINDIRKRLNYGGFPTGNTLYFKDRDGLILAPLEALFAQLAPQDNFIQEATWGKDWFDIVRAERAIISAVADVDYNKNGRAGTQDIAGTSTQEKSVFDLRTKKETVRKMASSIQGGTVVGTAFGLMAPILNNAAGGHGGKPNYMVMDGAHLPTSTDPSSKTERESLYNAIAKNGPTITVKVPVQSGINCTVGKGATLKLLPPMGDFFIGQNSMSGLYLVTDLCHELSLDDKMMNGVTIMQCARGGLG